MGIWGEDYEEASRPKVISAKTLVLSVVLHLLGAVAIVVVAWVNGLLEPKETVIPIDLTVIVNENLDGKENEPPPLVNPPPPKPKPPKQKPKPKPTVKPPEPPKALEQIVTNVVKTVEKKVEKKEEKKPEKKEEKKKELPKKPEEKKESQEDRLKRMRESAVKNKKPVKIEVKDAKRSGDGKTEKQTMSKDEILKALGAGARAGTTNQLTNDETTRCVSLIRMAISDQWDKIAPKVGNSGDVLLTCRLNSSGGLVGVRVTRSCGDKLSDQAALSVARSVGAIRGLSDSFISKYMKEEITIKYTVRGR